MSAPSIASPNRQSMFRRHGSRSTPAGLVLASTIVVAAPTPCSRTGFHMISISLCLPERDSVWPAPGAAVLHAALALAPVDVVTTAQVGATMSLVSGAA